MDLPKPIHPGHTNNEPINMDLPPSDIPPKKEKKFLAIALIASFVLLLASVGLAAWLFMQKGGGNTVTTKLDPNSTNNVLDVEWVPPAMPAGYAAYNQSTNTAKVYYYTNLNEGCSVVSRVMQKIESSDQANAIAKLNDSEGITTKTVAGEGSTSLTVNDSDAESKRQYDFKGFEYDQDVNVPTVDYKGMSGVAYYREFGNNLAIISLSCKVTTFDANIEDLQTLAKQFTIKTERE